MSRVESLTSNMPTIVMLGCFDTKGEDFGFLYDCLIEQGTEVISIDTSVYDSTAKFRVDYNSEVVADAGKTTLAELRNSGDRSSSLEKMALGARKIISDLLAAGRVAGVIGMGGGGGTFVCLSAMQSLPMEIPKLCLSTVATKDLSRQTGAKNIVLMPSVVDIAGLNKVSRMLIRQAAGALVGMVKTAVSESEIKNKLTIAISMFGNTTTCVENCTDLLQAQGYEVLAFHAVGAGGRTMESLIREGLIDAVLDITTTELADELCDGICSAGKERLTAAADLGVPQVVVPGCLDMVNYGHVDTVPDRFKDRLLFSWAPDVTLMRTNAAENKVLGQEIAEKLNASKGKVTVCIPLNGISKVSMKGGVFYAPEIDQVLFDTLKSNLSTTIPVIELPVDINDLEFSKVAVRSLLELL